MSPVHFAYYPKDTFAQKYPWDHFISEKSKLQWYCQMEKGGLRIEKISGSGS